MGLRSPNVPFSEMDQRQSDQYARAVPVVPDANSVGEDILKDGSVTEPKFAGGAVSTRALADKAVTPEKISDANALTLFGRLLNTNGTRSDLAFPTDGQFAVRRGTQITADTLQDADIPSSIARDTEVTAAANAAQAAAVATSASALAAHVAAPDPHPGYLTQAEADALYQPLASVLSMIHTGAGSPESVLTATVGHIYLRNNGGAGTTLYVKESGSGNTGWIAK